jgi:hypothetical protein
LPASYARDVFVPLVVLGASLSIAFVVLTQEAVVSTRRQTVRHTCSCVANGVPAGITNEGSGSSAAFASSHVRSIHAT